MSCLITLKIYKNGESEIIRESFLGATEKTDLKDAIIIKKDADDENTLTFSVDQKRFSYVASIFQEINNEYPVAKLVKENISTEEKKVTSVSATFTNINIPVKVDFYVLIQLNILQSKQAPYHNVLRIP